MSSGLFSARSYVCMLFLLLHIHSTLQNIYNSTLRCRHPGTRGAGWAAAHPGFEVGGQPYANAHPVLKVGFFNFHNASPQNRRDKRQALWPKCRIMTLALASFGNYSAHPLMQPGLAHVDNVRQTATMLTQIEATNHSPGGRQQTDSVTPSF